MRKLNNNYMELFLLDFSTLEEIPITIHKDVVCSTFRTNFGGIEQYYVELKMNPKLYEFIVENSNVYYPRIQEHRVPNRETYFYISGKEYLQMQRLSFNSIEVRNNRIWYLE